MAVLKFRTHSHRPRQCASASCKASATHPFARKRTCASARRRRAKRLRKRNCAEPSSSRKPNMAVDFLDKLTALRRTHYILVNLSNKYTKRDPRSASWFCAWTSFGIFSRKRRATQSANARCRHWRLHGRYLRTRTDQAAFGVP